MKQFITIALAGAALSSACWSYDSPTAPTAAAPPTGGGITGVVYEVTAAGRQPIADVGVDMSATYQVRPPQVSTDGAGRFVFPGSTPTLGQKLVAQKAGYSQPCRQPVENANADQDIHLVRDDLLSRTGMPSAFPVVGTVLSGTVFEQKSFGRQPVTGAAVTLDTSGGLGWAPSAQTRTGPDGRFALCNVGATGGSDLWVVLDGYVDVVRALPTTLPDTFQIELRPR
jgi:hypothetical protein